MGFLNSGAAKAWRDIWGAGHGIGAVTEIGPTAAVVDRLAAEYDRARAPRWADRPQLSGCARKKSQMSAVALMDSVSVPTRAAGKISDGVPNQR
ncbi:hypothetical protein [Nocardia grenadensis]|uniref:hypothetical protein n=1 Tax=Nocardia grenadensis TaxID=931537 RepID=UPI003D8EE182